MNLTLLARSIRDSWLLAVSCAALLVGFVWLRIWIASRIQLEAFVTLFSGGMQVFQDLLPVPLDELASPLGRSAFGFEEFPVIVLAGLWTVTRGTDCIVGRVGAGVMEMLLAQPVRRISVVASHTAVSLGGILLLAAAAWLGSAIGISVSSFDKPPNPADLAPAVVNFIGFCIFLLGGSTLVSALAQTRPQAVAIVIGFYVVELALMILSRLSPSGAWAEKLTFLTAYDPTFLSLGLSRAPAEHWPVFWQYNGILFGLGAAMIAAATALFCHRDVPAPV